MNIVRGFAGGAKLNADLIGAVRNTAHCCIAAKRGDAARLVDIIGNIVAGCRKGAEQRIVIDVEEQSPEIANEVIGVAFAGNRKGEATVFVFGNRNRHRRHSVVAGLGVECKGQRPH